MSKQDPHTVQVQNEVLTIMSFAYQFVEENGTTTAEMWQDFMESDTPEDYKRLSPEQIEVISHWIGIAVQDVRNLCRGINRP